METHNIMSFKAMLLLLLFSIVLAKADLHPSTILKTIVSGKETIDCVDKYKQPAFNHPLLKNHTLRSKPSSYPVGSNSIVSTKLTQKWHESGEFCPEGTVPILRKPANYTTSNDKPKPSYDFSKTDGETGCYDLDCPGFVQESKTVTLGAEMTPVSTYGGKQHQFNVKIYKVSTNNSGCWKKFVYIS
ncbi:hypothetical protein LINPERPRIM_LOCUS26980 [Linum perenne]